MPRQAPCPLAPAEPSVCPVLCPHASVQRLSPGSGAQPLSTQSCVCCQTPLPLGPQSSPVTRLAGGVVAPSRAFSHAPTCSQLRPSSSRAHASARLSECTEPGVETLHADPSKPCRHACPSQPMQQPAAPCSGRQSRVVAGAGEEGGSGLTYRPLNGCRAVLSVPEGDEGVCVKSFKPHGGALRRGRRSTASVVLPWQQEGMGAVT